MTRRKAKVVGITRGVNNSGVAYTRLHLNIPHDDKQNGSGSVGVMSESYYVDDGLKPKVTNDIVGKEVVVSTLYANKKMYLCDING